MSTLGADARLGGLACVVRVAGRTFAVPIARAREVRVFESYTRVPLAPPALIGMANLRGAIVPILDLRRLLGYPVPPLPRRLDTLIVEADGTCLALAVDAVLGIEPLEPSRDEPVEEAEAPLLRGALQRGEEAVPVLDIAAIVNSLAAPAAGPARQEVR